jgi:hypothetical protein
MAATHMRRLKENGSNPFIALRFHRQATPRHSSMFSFWRGQSGSEMQALPGEILQARLCRRLLCFALSCRYRA